MESSAQPPVDRSEPGAATKGQELHLKLDCPKCAHPLRIEIRQLPLLLQCQKCANAFWIDRGGHIQSQHESGSTYVTCPRCQQTRQYPKAAKLRKLRCLACSFEIPLGHPSPSPSSSSAAPDESPRRPGAKQRDGDFHLSPWAMGAISVVLILLSGLAVAWVAPTFQTDQALLDAADVFTAAVVRGDVGTAKQSVSSDQQEPLQRWLSLYPYHPATPPSGEREVRVLEYAETAARVQVKYDRTLRDTATQRQSWRRDLGGAWQFDAEESLRRLNEP